MGFWGEKVNVSREAAAQQINIISSFSAEKRMKIALDFANLGVNRTRTWIKENNPSFSEHEITLEWVKLMYYERGEMQEETWKFYETTMKKKIRKHWATRFRKMMLENNWSYDDIAKMGNFKNGKVVEATISRGLPAFAKISVLTHESHQLNKVQ
ncbi:MAG: hypothetical protein AAF738_07030 [Bacteroidota bacterium]